MSAIGDYYVHFRAINYKNEGINFYEGNVQGQPPTINDLILNENYISAKYKNNFNIAKREEQVKYLQQQYQKMLYGTSSTEFNFQQQMRDALNQLLIQKFQEGAGKVNTNNLLQSNISQDSVIKAGQKLLTIDKNTELTGTELRHLIRQINEWLNIIQQNEGTVEELLQKVGYQNFSSITGQLTKISNIIGLRRLTIKQNEISYMTLKKIIDAIKEIDVPIVLNQANQQGEIGEWVTPWIENFLSIKSKKAASVAVDELIQSAKAHQKGKEGIYVAFEYGENGFKKYELQEKQLSDISINGKYSKLDFKYHTSKTDATFSWRSGLSDIEELASIKNYSSFNGLTIVNNTALDSILSNGGSQEWAAHYVNTMIAHEDDSTNGGFLSGLRTQAQISFNKLALYTGLLGYSEKQAPTLFIIFNSNSKQVKIYDPYILLLKLTDENSPFGSFKIESTYGKATAVLSKGQLLTQHFAKTKQQRIGMIQSHIHQHKIHISISVGN